MRNQISERLLGNGDDKIVPTVVRQSHRMQILFCYSQQPVKECVRFLFYYLSVVQNASMKVCNPAENKTFLE